MAKLIKLASLEWPTTEEKELPVTTVQCAGEAFLQWSVLRSGDGGNGEFLEDSLRQSTDDDDDDDDNGENGNSGTKLNLLKLSEAKLKKLTYYEILGNLPLHATTDQIKKAYHKASLKYHPDKTGRGREDELFLKVKAAFETLGDFQKRLAYDSTMPFNDNIPKGGESEQAFYRIYKPVFERNLRFDARLHPDRRPKSAQKNSNKRKQAKSQPPPEFGDDETPVEQVNRFYEYWVHFESWRDFSRKAQEETDKEYGDPDNADSRFEKRWIQKEIDKRARKHKLQEMNRINTLVERAMASDPRLIRERQREKAEKERIARERKAAQEEAERKAKEEKERLEKETAEREAAEKKAKAEAKVQKDREKKVLRKARQLLRKLSIAAYAENNKNVWKDMEAMNDDVEFLCSNLTAQELGEISEAMGGQAGLENPRPNELVRVQLKCRQVREGKSAEFMEAELEKQRAREAAEEKERQDKAARAKAPWSKEELTALNKAVKKYPGGGANRWSSIAMFVNNMCRPEDPRTKEECIERYNQIQAGIKLPSSVQAAKGGGGDGSGNTNGTNGTTAKAATSNGATAGADDDGWTVEQNKQLQDALGKFPASMDKNERWAAIAKAVTGKSKKDCVQRFKAIREALKNKK